ANISPGMMPKSVSEIASGCVDVGDYCEITGGDYKLGQWAADPKARDPCGFSPRILELAERLVQPLGQDIPTEAGTVGDSHAIALDGWRACRRLDRYPFMEGDGVHAAFLRRRKRQMGHGGRVDLGAARILDRDHEAEFDSKVAQQPRLRYAADARDLKGQAVGGTFAMDIEQILERGDRFIEHHRLVDPAPDPPAFIDRVNWLP